MRRAPVFEGDHLAFLKAYIREPEFKILFNNLVRSQVALNYRSLSFLSRDNSSDKSFFICALALAYTCYLQSKVLIVETKTQPRTRSLFLESILGEHTTEDWSEVAINPGCIDLLSTESFLEDDHELADFQLGEHIRRNQNQYDIVLVETAPLSEIDETAIHPLIISRFMDQSVLVVSREEKELHLLDPVVRAIQVNDVPLLGVVEGIPELKDRKKRNNLSKKVIESVRTLGGASFLNKRLGGSRSNDPSPRRMSGRKAFSKRKSA